MLLLAYELVTYGDGAVNISGWAILCIVAILFLTRGGS